MGFRRASHWCGGLLLAPAGASTLHMGGTGAATEPLRLIGARFTTKTAIAVEIILGLGSSGGISAALEGVLQMASPNASFRRPKPRAT